MKLVNTMDLRRILEEDASEAEFSFENDEAPGPLRHFSVRLKDDAIVLSLDGQEIMRQSISKMNLPGDPDLELAYRVMDLWGAGDMDGVKLELKLIDKRPPPKPEKKRRRRRR